MHIMTYPPHSVDAAQMNTHLLSTQEQRFFERQVLRLAKAMRISDVIDLVNETREHVKAQKVGLNLGGVWYCEPPAWLDYVKLPNNIDEVIVQIYTLPSALLVTFGRGCCIFYDRDDPFSEDDIYLVKNVAQLLTPVVEALELRHVKAQQALEEHERALAARLWRQVIPAKLPNMPHYEIVSLCEPASDVGGDFQFAKDGWLAMGDVSGKGVPASFLSSMIVSALHVSIVLQNMLQSSDILITQTPNAFPVDLAAGVETALYDTLEAMDLFITMVATELNPNGKVNYFNLGHPPMLLKRSSGEVEFLKSLAPPLGLVKKKRYPTRSVTLDPGDMILMYSDGLSEAMHPETQDLLGDGPLKHIMQKSTTPNQVHENIKTLMQTWQAQDDLTVIVLKYTGPSI